MKLIDMKIQAIIKTGTAVLTLSLLFACTGSHMVVVGEKKDAREVEQVVLFYDRLPDCEVTVVAYMQSPGYHDSPESLIDAFRHQAASVGADALHILDIQRTGAAEYLGSARAISCESPLK